MKKNRTVIIACLLSGTLFYACHKAETNPSGIDFPTLEQEVVNDFVSNVALPQYNNLTLAAGGLNAAIVTLNTTPTDVNLAAAQASWKTLRRTWEQCEGFLFGPVEDNDYDPNTDTWPTDYTQMDSLLASSNTLEPTDIQNLPQSLRGYHPIEYTIFGVGGSRTAASLTAREKKYMVSLASDVLNNNVQPLYDDWASAPVHYDNQVLTAGKGSTKFNTRQELYLAIVGAMTDISEEVGNGKMFEPFTAKDSTITESPYSGNTLSDFKDNIVGLQNVYLGLNGGKGIKDLVAAKNKSLDNQIQAQITSAISSFSNITLRYEQAIYDQRTQVQQTMTQLNTLRDLLDDELKNFITTYIKD